MADARKKPLDPMEEHDLRAMGDTPIPTGRIWATLDESRRMEGDTGATSVTCPQCRTEIPYSECRMFVALQKRCEELAQELVDAGELHLAEEQTIRELERMVLKEEKSDEN